MARLLAEVPEIQRTAFIGSLSGAVAHAQQHSVHLGMLLIDLTNLSTINHHHGYHTGDLMLAAAYRELLGVSKLPDTVFRVGSHRFAFILPGLNNPAFISLALNIQAGMVCNPDLPPMLRLRELGCDSIQGYYVSKPLPAKEFESWLRAWPGLPGIQ